jgi:hypothetical protein
MQRYESSSAKIADLVTAIIWSRPCISGPENEFLYDLDHTIASVGVRVIGYEPMKNRFFLDMVHEGTLKAPRSGIVLLYDVHPCVALRVTP